MNDVFIDLLLNININKGIARVDFARIENVDSEKKQISFSPSLRLIMSVETFSQVSEQFEKAKLAIASQSNVNTIAS